MGKEVDKNLRKPYIMSEEEINMLVNGILSFGHNETHSRIKSRAETAMVAGDNFVDETLMDMYETVLSRARVSEDDMVKSAMYCLTRILRSVAHEARKYYRNKSESHRFLHLATCNKDFVEF
jgi:hypothetical protein